MDTIFIKGLQLEAVIGVYSHERTIKQPIILDLEIFLDTSLAGSSEMIADTVDYDLVVSTITKCVDDSNYRLIESLANHLADVLCQAFKFNALKLTLYKPQAISNASTVGITLTRQTANL